MTNEEKYKKLYELIDFANNRIAPNLRHLSGSELESEERKWKESHIEDLLNIRSYSEENNLFYNDCSARIYKNYYPLRLNHFLKNNFESEESDFIEIEIDRILDGGKTYRFDEAFNLYKFSHKKIVSFLEEKLDSLKISSKKVDSFTPFKAVQSFSILGILDFLKDQKGMNFQNQAKFISHLIDKSEANILKEISNRRNTTSPITKKKQFDNLKKWIDNQLLQNN